MCHWFYKCLPSTFSLKGRPGYCFKCFSPESFGSNQGLLALSFLTFRSLGIHMQAYSVVWNGPEFKADQFPVFSIPYMHVFFLFPSVPFLQKFCCRKMLSMYFSMLRLLPIALFSPTSPLFILLDHCTGLHQDSFCEWCFADANLCACRY